MNYGELRTLFKNLLNRNDVTDTQCDMFIALGIRRTERTLRTPLQRSYLQYTVPANWNGKFGVPSDYLGFHYLKVNDIAVYRIDTNAAGKGEVGDPSAFFIDNGSFQFRPLLKEGDVISLGYISEFSQTSDPVAITRFSVVIPDLIVYSALVFACDFFTDARKLDFETSFMTLKAEVQELAYIDDMAGGVAVQNPYAGIV